MNPATLRTKIRTGEYTTSTSGQCPGYVQANIAILPKEFAKDFETFCNLNHQACPLLEVLEAGNPYSKKLVKPNQIGDIRTDVPKYRIYRQGKLIEEVTSIEHLWRDDLVTFFLGCSFSFENALQEANIPIKNIQQGKNVSMYLCHKVKCNSVPPYFENIPLVVSMRPVARDKVELAKQITSKFTHTHGATIYCGWDYHQELGVNENLQQVDFGDAVDFDVQSEVPCFWQCGVTAIMSSINAKSDICITHSPGHMFVADVTEEDLL